MQTAESPRNNVFGDNADIFDAAFEGDPGPERDMDRTTLHLPVEDYGPYTDKSTMASVSWYDSYRDRMGEGKLSAAFVEAAVTDDRLYGYVVEMIQTKATSELTVTTEGDTVGERPYINVPVVSLAEGILQSQELYDGDPVRRQRAAEIITLTSAEQMKQDYQDNTYRAMIDGVLVEFPVTDLLDVLTASDEDYRQFVESGENKEQMAYALVKFVRSNELLASYVLDNRVRDRYMALKSYQDIDFEALNKLTVTPEGEEEYRNGFVMNDELHDAILEGVPEDADPLERSIRIYLNMCKLLTYSPEYYAVAPQPMYAGENNPAQAALAHRFKQVSKVSRISPENNEAVCFEFNLIFEQFLEEQGLNFKTVDSQHETPYSPFGNGYGDAHEYTVTRADDFLLSFDSVTSIMGGDLANVKLGIPPKGIQCHNTNPATKARFAAIVSQVYEQFQESNEFPAGVDTAFRNAMERYNAESEPVERVPTGDKASLWMDMVNNAVADGTLKGVDAFAYAAHMYAQLFTATERDNNVRIAMLSDQLQKPESLARPGMVISVNDQTFAEQAGTRYFAAGPGKNLVEVSYGQLARGFSEGRFTYMSGIPERQIAGLELVPINA
ncbi:MAG TPA: hypothetical protein VLG92_02015 [Candidatus Saccharimonadia bacterium]|nr:hypothetical protein [Candidatus Saccharimonadia bacterium]